MGPGTQAGAPSELRGQLGSPGGTLWSPSAKEAKGVEIARQMLRWLEISRQRTGEELGEAGQQGQKPTC